MEGLSKEYLEKCLSVVDIRDVGRHTLLTLLIADCKELDPWLVVDATTPKDRELAFITKEYGKVIGKWFSVNQGGWWVANHMPITPTYYKELPPDPKE